MAKGSRSVAISVDDWVTGRSQPGPYGAGTDGRRTWEARITVGMGGHHSGGGPVAGASGAARAPAPRRVHPGDVDDVTGCRTARATGRAVRPARPVAFNAVVLSLALLAGGCGSGGGDSAGGDESEVGGASVPDRLDVPLGSDPAAVAPYVEDLLASYSESVNLITATPTLAATDGDPTVQAYLDAFEPGSAIAAQAIDYWHDQGAIGVSTRPYDPAQPAFATTLAGPVETVDDDEVTFPTCNELAFETVNAAGQRVDVEPGASVPGEGTAVRVDDGWRLRRLDRFEGTEGCRGDS